MITSTTERRDHVRKPRRPYRGRVVALATKHGKERAIGRPLQAALGLEVVVPPNLDTDALGTFSGEVERVGTPKEVALRKARLGMAAAELPYGLASEGSFGPHPFIPFLPIGQELLATACPACGAPGWGRIDVELGLPCMDCGTPTDLVRAEILGCAACDHRSAHPRPDGRSHAEPGQCPYCNP